MKRLYKEGLVTTLIGLGLLAFTGVIIYQGKSTASEMSGWITVALMFLRSKDSLIGLSDKKEDI